MDGEGTHTLPHSVVDVPGERAGPATRTEDGPHTSLLDVRTMTSMVTTGTQNDLTPRYSSQLFAKSCSEMEMAKEQFGEKISTASILSSGIGDKTGEAERF